jgi:hypothetical protein
MLDWILAGAAGEDASSQEIYRDRGMYIERFLLKAFI